MKEDDRYFTRMLLTVACFVLILFCSKFSEFYSLAPNSITVINRFPLYLDDLV